MAIKNALADIRTMNALFSAAETEARTLGDDQPAAEHLLLAALTLDDASARTAFATLGASADDVRSAIRRTHSTALHALGLDADVGNELDKLGTTRVRPRLYKTAGSLQDMFQVARLHAAADHPSPLRSAHIAIAAAEREHGTVARALDLLGIDRVRLVDAARGEIAS